MPLIARQKEEWRRPYDVLRLYYAEFLKWSYPVTIMLVPDVANFDRNVFGVCLFSYFGNRLSESV